MGWSRPTAFDRINHNLTAKHCYFGCSRSPIADGIKSFDKDDQATNIKMKVQWSGHLYETSDPINIRRP